MLHNLNYKTMLIFIIFITLLCLNIYLIDKEIKENKKNDNEFI